MNCVQVDPEQMIVMDIVQSRDDAIKYKANADQIKDIEDKGKVNQGNYDSNYIC